MNEAVPNNSSPAEGYSADPATGAAFATGLTDNHRIYASWCHWAPLIAQISVIASGGISFFVPSLVALAMWQIKNKDSQFIDDQGKEALNFQISLLLLGLIFIPLIFCGVGVILLMALPFLAIVGGIMGGIQSANGTYFRYPMCIRLV